MSAATDAFGTSIGREEIGLYDAFSVRGFSPSVAGNVRIDGLYFDQVWGLNSRIRESTRIRVGPAVVGYPFPAPTGIVDYALRRPGDVAVGSALVAVDEWGGASVELDGVVPLRRSLSLGIGAAWFADETGAGTDGRYANAATTLRWRPDETLDVLAFASRSEGRNDETAPIYVPAGPFLPPRLVRRRFDGPDWADYRGVAENYGLIASTRLSGGWHLDVGAFRSSFDDDATYANLVTDLEPSGLGRRIVVADPPTLLAATSGEVRARHDFTVRDSTHRFLLSVRPRERVQRYDGSAFADLGVAAPGERVTVARPAFVFGPQTRDRVRQVTWGVGYEWRTRSGLEIGSGLQKTSYTKRVRQPNAATGTTAAPWLYSVNAAYGIAPTLAVYASHARGLEESGVAPATASNRNEALPAISTRQVDVGIRYRPKATTSFVLGVFEVRKPYFELDEANRFGELGAVTHRGAEFSATLEALAGLRLVGGAVYLDPRVSGRAVALGRVAARPVGQPRVRAELSADWQVPGSRRWSLDATVAHTSSVPATRDDAVRLPGRTLVDVGARLRFTIDSHPATLRWSVTNVGNEYGYDLVGGGAYTPIDGRRASLYLTLDR